MTPLPLGHFEYNFFDRPSRFVGYGFAFVPSCEKNSLVLEDLPKKRYAPWKNFQAKLDTLEPIPADAGLPLSTVLFKTNLSNGRAKTIGVYDAVDLKKVKVDLMQKVAHEFTTHAENDSASYPLGGFCDDAAHYAVQSVLVYAEAAKQKDGDIKELATHTLHQILTACPTIGIYMSGLAVLLDKNFSAFGNETAWCNDLFPGMSLE